MTMDAVCPVAKGDAICYWKGMWQKLNTMRQMWQLCDVTIFSEDNAMYMAHSPVLAASSDVFHSYFVERTPTIVEELSERKLLLKTMPADILQITLDFIYGVTPVTKSELEKLQSGAKILGIHGAYSYCKQRIKAIQNKSFDGDSSLSGDSAEQGDKENRPADFTGNNVTGSRREYNADSNAVLLNGTGQTRRGEASPAPLYGGNKGYSRVAFKKQLLFRTEGRSKTDNSWQSALSDSESDKQLCSASSPESEYCDDVITMENDLPEKETQSSQCPTTESSQSHREQGHLVGGNNVDRSHCSDETVNKNSSHPSPGDVESTASAKVFQPEILPPLDLSHALLPELSLTDLAKVQCPHLQKLGKTAASADLKSLEAPNPSTAFDTVHPKTESGSKSLNNENAMDTAHKRPQGNENTGAESRCKRLTFTDIRLMQELYLDDRGSTSADDSLPSSPLSLLSSGEETLNSKQNGSYHRPRRKSKGHIIQKGLDGLDSDIGSGCTDKPSNHVQNLESQKSKDDGGFDFQSYSQPLSERLREETNEDNKEILSLLKLNGKREYACQMNGCGYTNKHVDYLQSHMYHRHNVGMPTKPCTIPNCEKSYFSDSQVHSHIKRAHERRDTKDGNPAQCPECGETFGSNYTLQTHMLKAHGVGKLYSCELCQFKSPRKKDVQAHLLSQHNKAPPGVRVYTCPFCEYKCVDRNRYEEHEAMHTGIQKFNCPLCRKAFTTKRGMRTHMKYHSDERPHKCELCGAKFKVRSKLKDHTRLLHTQPGLKPYQCGYCCHRTALRGNCNQHIRRHHPGQPIFVIDHLASQRKAVKDYDYARINGDGIMECTDIRAARWASIGDSSNFCPPPASKPSGDVEASSASGSSAPQLACGASTTQSNYAEHASFDADLDDSSPKLWISL